MPRTAPWSHTFPTPPESLVSFVSRLDGRPRRPSFEREKGFLAVPGSGSKRIENFYDS